MVIQDRPTIARRKYPLLRRYIMRRPIVAPSTPDIIFGLSINVLPDSATVCTVFARQDDYFFGALHSKCYMRLWSLRRVSAHRYGPKGSRPRYTPTTTFETFPFPWSPGDEDESHPAHAAISAAAAQLHEERHAWLNPEDVSAKELKDRTLTNLYNALQVWRKKDSMKTKEAARDFAPRSGRTASRAGRGSFATLTAGSTPSWITKKKSCGDCWRLNLERAD